VNEPFIGRRDELDRLAELQRRAHRAGLAAASLITGEPGTGKSRLLAEVLDQTTVPQGRLIGFEPIRSVPLASAAPLFRLLAEVPGPGRDLERLVFGELAQESRDPLRIFEAAHRALASSRPMLIAIDDLQWVDDLSIGLIHYLLQAAETSGSELTVIAAARPSPAARTFAAALSAVVPDDRQAHIELGPLALEEGVSLVQALDASLDDGEAAGLWRRARGSPFWLQALVLGDQTADPSALIQDRLRVVSGDAAALLTALAVGGRPLKADDLAWVLDWGVERVRDVARELINGGLVVDVAGMLRMGHDLIREAAQHDIPSATRERLHARFASLLERDAGNDIRLLREALEHRTAAGMATAHLAIRMVRSPQRRLLGTEGLSVLASIADGQKAGSAEQLMLDMALGELGSVLGAQQLAIERWTRVSESATDVRQRQRAELEAARAAFLAGQRPEAHLYLDRARQLGGAAPDIDVRLHTLEADISLWLDHETAAGTRAANRALASAEEMAAADGGPKKLSPAQRATYLAALHTATDAAMQEDRGGDVIRLSQSSLLLARGLDEESRVGALLRIGIALLPFGQLREAEASLREAWDTARRLVMPTAMVEAGNGLARALPMLGRFAEARAIALEACAIESRLGNAPRRWGNPSPWLHVIELAMGDISAAVSALRHDAEVETDPHFRLRIHQNLATWRARSGGVRVARDVETELAAAHADSDLAACPRCASELAVTSAELLARIGRAEDARLEMGVWLNAPGTSYPMREVRRARAEAAIAEAEGELGSAASTLGTLATELQREGLLEELLWARLDLGRVLARLDRVASVRALTSAAMLAEEVGAKSQQRLAAQQLRRLGVRTWRRGPGVREPGLPGLTPREAEVARLAAAGSSNQEIASSLAISPRTVERHITNVLTKLGLRNRTELATAVHSADRVRGSTDDRKAVRS
jgi:DNA-binding CsgD family transcriptional regulator/tetratricopeptide (TPR) repeat protein